MTITIRVRWRLAMPLLFVSALILSGCGEDQKATGPAGGTEQVKASTNAMADFMKTQKPANKKK